MSQNKLTPSQRQELGLNRDFACFEMTGTRSWGGSCCSSPFDNGLMSAELADRQERFRWLDWQRSWPVAFRARF